VFLIAISTAGNKEYRSSMVEFSAATPEWATDLLFDPQTSGGLLIALPLDEADDLIGKLRQAGHSRASVIGRFLSGIGGSRIVVSSS
ncbi:MAG: hypothetical protein SVM79_06005, partial [Chloroflexota bacterium]|nr:hypothetical protein [Chloroflexota bacterium]